MTITTLETDREDTLGFEISGDVTKADYEVLTPAVAAAVDEHGTIKLLLDLTGFRWEKVSAWGSDLRFGREFRHKIERLAIVGNKRWEEHLADLASPWYAEESSYFEERDAATSWLQS